MKKTHDEFNTQLIDRLNASHSKIDDQVLKLQDDILGLAERLGENAGRQEQINMTFGNREAETYSLLERVSNDNLSFNHRIADLELSPTKIVKLQAPTQTPKINF